MITFIYHLYNLRVALPTFIMLGSSPQFLALWAPLRWITAVLPKSAYVTLDDKLFSLYQRLILFFFERYTGTEVYLYGDAVEVLKEEKKENVIYISNHQCTLDWVVSEMIAVRQGSLGHVRYILKDGLRYFPLYGFYFRQHSCVYVDRNKRFSEERAIQQLSELNELPFWLVIFPEGTRYSPDRTEVLEKSQQFARENRLAVCDEVLTPRSKATWLSLTSLRRKADALYDVTIAYSETVGDGRRLPATGLPDYLAANCPKIHIHIKRHSIDSIPLNDEQTFRVWLAQQFYNKDKLMKHFYSARTPDEATLGPNGQLSPLQLRQTFPAFVFWLSALAPLVLTPGGRTWYLRLGASGAILGAAWMLVRK